MASIPTLDSQRQYHQAFALLCKSNGENMELKTRLETQRNHAKSLVESDAYKSMDSILQGLCERMESDTRNATDAGFRNLDSQSEYLIDLPRPGPTLSQINHMTGFARSVGELVRLAQEPPVYEEQQNLEDNRHKRMLELKDADVHKLKQDAEKLKDELSRCRQDIGKDCTSLAKSKDELGQCRQELTEERTSLARLKDELNQCRQDLKEERTSLVKIQKTNEELEKEAAMKEPLFQVGKIVRLRFLAQASQLFRGSTEQASVKRLLGHIAEGNAKAHCGLKDTDVTLFTGGFLSMMEVLQYGEIFQKLYDCKPHAKETRPKKLIEVVDYRATIMTVKAANNGLNRPIKERGLAMDHIEAVISKHPKLKGDDFNTDEDVERRLQRVKELIRDIIEQDMLHKRLTAVRIDTSY